MSIGLGHRRRNITAEHDGSIVFRQLDPDGLDFAVFSLTAIMGGTVKPVASILSTVDAIGDYAALREAWRFTKSGIDTYIPGTGTLTFTGTAHSAPLSSHWSPDDPIAGEVDMPANITYTTVATPTPETHTFEYPMGGSSKARIGFTLANTPLASGTITWYRNDAATGYIVTPGSGAHVFQRVRNPTWPGTWKQWHFTIP